MIIEIKSKTNLFSLFMYNYRIRYKEDKMKKSIHIFLIIIAIICLGNIFKLLRSDLIDIQTLEYDVFMGIFLSVIFYFIVDYIPQYSKKKRGFKLIQIQLSVTLSSIQTILNVTKDYYNITGDMKRLTSIDWDVISDEVDPTLEQIVVSTKSKRNRKCKIKNSYYVPAGSMGPNNINDIVRSELKTIQTQLDEIFTYESYFVDDESLFENLTKLKNSKLLELYTEKYTFNYFSNTYDYMYELQNIYFALKKQNIHYYDSISLIDTSKKAKEYLQKYNSKQLMPVWIDFQNQRSKLFSNTKRFVFFEKGQMNKTIASKIVGNFEADLLELNGNNLNLSNDVNIVITSVLRAILLYLKNINCKNLIFLIVKVRIIGSIIKHPRFLKLKGTNITICLLPVSFNIISKVINENLPSPTSLTIVSQAVYKQFDEKYDLKMDT